MTFTRSGFAAAVASMPDKWAFRFNLARARSLTGDWAGAADDYKRAAQLFSKSRFIAAQFEAYFEDGLWLESARHANQMAGRLAATIRASKSIRLAWEPQANEVFAIMPEATIKDLQDKGARGEA